MTNKKHLYQIPSLMIVIFLSITVIILMFLKIKNSEIDPSFVVDQSNDTRDQTEQSSIFYSEELLNELIDVVTTKEKLILNKLQNIGDQAHYFSSDIRGTLQGKNQYQSFDSDAQKDSLTNKYSLFDSRSCYSLSWLAPDLHINNTYYTDNYLLYDTEQDLQIIYQINNAIISEKLVMSKKPEFNQIIFQIKTSDNLQVIKNSDYSLSVCDKNDDSQKYWNILPSYIVDRKGNAMLVDANIIEDTIVYELDKNYLSSASYPVVIFTNNTPVNWDNTPLH